MSLIAGAIVFDGNSLTKGTIGNPIPYPTQFATYLRPHPGLVLSNVSANGRNTLQMIDLAPTLVDPLLSAGPTNALLAWEITNDLTHNGSPSESVANLRRYCQDRRAAGWTTIVTATCTPKTRDVPDFEAHRQAANALLRDGYQSFADALVDVGSLECVLGFDGAQDDPTYYFDQLHMTTAGYALVAQKMIAALIPDAAGYVYQDDSTLQR